MTFILPVSHFIGPLVPTAYVLSAILFCTCPHTFYILALTLPAQLFALILLPSALSDGPLSPLTDASRPPSRPLPPLTIPICPAQTMTVKRRP